MKKTSAVFHVLLLRSKNSSSYHYCSKAIFLMTGLVVMNSCHSIHLKFGLRLVLQAALFGLRLIEFANRINGWWYVKLSPGSSLSWRTFFVKSFLLKIFCEINFTKKKSALSPPKRRGEVVADRPPPSRGVLAELKWGYIRFKLGFFPTYRGRRIFNFINIMSFWT